MNRKILGVGASLVASMLLICPATAQGAEPTPAKGHATAGKSAAASVPEIIPNDFIVPTLVTASSFRIEPLGPEKAKVDFNAYMSSIEHLQQTFSRSTNWPRQGITQAEAMQDMESEQARFKARKSFAYSVLTPDGSRERGCIYISRSPVAGYDAMVRMWVTKADYDAGFDAELYRWVKEWVRTKWPFARVAYPGREIGWNTWDAQVAAAKAAQSAAPS